MAASSKRESEKLKQEMAALAAALERSAINADPQPVSRETTTGPPESGVIDRRRWRLADMRPNTPSIGPWTVTKCHNCLAPMYTRDPLSVWEKGALCEECSYILRSELHEHGQRHFRIQARGPVDPFRPR